MVAVAAVLQGRAEPQRLVYTGELGTLYRIALVNLLLSVVTLGFYRFWGRVRLRRYLWNAIQLDGDPFEWTGTGWEMCRSFLIVATVALVVYTPAYVLTLAGPGYERLLLLHQFALGFVAVLVIGLAGFLGLRYRLSRTRWRGIRGDLTGSPVPYVWRSFGWTLAYGPTLFLIHPFATVDLRRWLIGRARLGDLRLECQARGGAVFPAFLGSIALTAAFLVLLIVVISGTIVVGTVVAVLTESSSDSIQAIGIALGIASALLILAARPCFSAIFDARLLRHLAETTFASGLSLITTVTGWRLFWLRFSNLLLLVVTLGFGLPIVWHRRARFFAENTRVVGIENADLIRQAEASPTRMSEGLLDVLDVGAV